MKHIEFQKKFQQNHWTPSLQVVAVVIAVGGKPREKGRDHGGQGGGGMICEAETAAA